MSSSSPQHVTVVSHHNIAPTSPPSPSSPSVTVRPQSSSSSSSLSASSSSRARKLTLSLDDIINEERKDSGEEGVTSHTNPKVNNNVVMMNVKKRGGGGGGGMTYSRGGERQQDNNHNNNGYYLHQAKRHGERTDRGPLWGGGVPVPGGDPSRKRLYSERVGVHEYSHGQAVGVGGRPRLPLETNSVLFASTEYSADGRELVVRFKKTEVVRVETQTGNVILNSGGWRTASTLSVINAALKPIGLWVREIDASEVIEERETSVKAWEVCGKWYQQRFEDNMVIGDISNRVTQRAALVARASVMMQHMQQVVKTLQARKTALSRPLPHRGAEMSHPHTAPPHAHAHSTHPHLHSHPTHPHPHAHHAHPHPHAHHPHPHPHVVPHARSHLHPHPPHPHTSHSAVVTDGVVRHCAVPHPHVPPPPPHVHTMGGEQHTTQGEDGGEEKGDVVREGESSEIDGRGEALRQDDVDLLESEEVKREGEEEREEVKREGEEEREGESEEARKVRVVDLPHGGSLSPLEESGERVGVRRVEAVGGARDKREATMGGLSDEGGERGSGEGDDGAKGGGDTEMNGAEGNSNNLIISNNNNNNNSDSGVNNDGGECTGVTTVSSPPSSSPLPSSSSATNQDEEGGGLGGSVLIAVEETDESLLNMNVME